MKNEHKKAARVRKRIKRTLLGLVVLLLLGSVFGFAFRDKISAKLKTVLDARLAEQGVFVDYETSGFSPFKGLTVSNIKFFESVEKERALLELSEAYVGFNLTDFFRSGASIPVSISSNDAELSLIADEEARTLKKLTSDLTLSSDSLFINRLSTSFRDVSVNLEGRLDWDKMAPEEVEPEAKPNTEKAPAEFPEKSSIDLGPILAYLDQVPDTPDGDLTVDGEVNFFGDQPALGWSIKAVGKTVNWKALTLSDLAIQTSSDETKSDQLAIVVPSAKFKFLDKTFQANGQYDLGKKILNLEGLKSEIDIKAFLSRIDEELGKKVPLLPAHQLEAAGKVVIDDLLTSDVNAKITIKEPTTLPTSTEGLELRFSSASTDLTLKDRMVTISDLEVALGEAHDQSPVTVKGEASLKLPETDGQPLSSVTINSLRVSQAGGVLETKGIVDFEAETITVESLQSNLDPAAVMTKIGLSDPADDVYSFAEPPQIAMKGMVPWGNLAASDLKGTLKLPGQTVFPAGEGSFAVDHAEMAFVMSDGSLTLPTFTANLGKTGAIGVTADVSMILPETGAELNPLNLNALNVSYGEGTISAMGSLNLANMTLDLTELNSTVMPFALMEELGYGDPTEGTVLLGSAPRLVAKGQVPLQAPLTGGLSGTLSVAGETKVSLSKSQVLNLAEIGTTFTLSEGAINLSDFSTKTLGGSVGYTGKIVSGPAMIHEGVLKVENVKLDQIDKLVDASHNGERTANVSVTFDGTGSTTMESLNGTGTVALTEAKFVSVPLYAGLRPLLMAINLGGWKGEKSGAQLDATYALADGVLTSEDIKLLGEFYEVGSKLNLDFVKKQVAASGVVATNGTTNIVTGLVGKLLEVEGSGSFDDIKWKLKNAPGLGTVGDVANLSTDLLQNTVKNLGTGTEGVKKVSETALDTVTDLSKLLNLGKKKEMPKEPVPTVTEPAPTEPTPAEPVPAEPAPAE